MKVHDKAALRAFKRQQQEALTGRKMAMAKQATVAAIHAPKICTDCNGTGKFDGLLHKRTCGACKGCGFDISDPLLVVQYQAELLRRGRDYYKKKAEECTAIQAQYDKLADLYGRDKLRHEQIEAVMRGEDGKGRLD